MKTFRIIWAAALAFACGLVLAGPVQAGGGVWNSKAFQARVLKQLKRDRRSFECRKNCVHSVIGEFGVDLGGKREMILVTASAERGADCHACGAGLSLFVFDRTENGWKQSRKYIAFTQWGSWGSVPPEWVDVRKLPAGRYGLFLTGSYMGQGYSSDVLEIFIERGKALKSALRACIGSSNAGAVGEDSKDLAEWNATYKVTGMGGKSLFEVKVTDKVTGKSAVTRYRIRDGKFTPVPPVDPRLEECG